MAERRELLASLRCKLAGHDYDFVTGAPVPRELRADGRPKLYKAILVCARCGHRGN